MTKYSMLCLPFSYFFPQLLNAALGNEGAAALPRPTTNRTLDHSITAHTTTLLTI
jgi:hypothetical protein